MWSLAEACEPCQDGGGFHYWRRWKEWRSGWSAALLRGPPALGPPCSSPAPPDTPLCSSGGQPAHSLLRAFALTTRSALEALVSSLHLSYSSGRPALPDRYPLFPGPPPPDSASLSLLLRALDSRRHIYFLLPLPQESKICEDKACLQIDLC